MTDGIEIETKLTTTEIITNYMTEIATNYYNNNNYLKSYEQTL